MPYRCLENDQIAVDKLRQSPLFSGLNDHDFNWLLDQAQETNIAEGEVLMAEGSPGGSLYIVLDGEFEFTKRSGQQQVVLARRGSGEMIGEFSLLDQAPRTATARATRDSRLIMIPQNAFQQLLSISPAATLAVLHTVAARLRNTEAMMRQNEKMASLGTLSAGLAHELNNPAAAARRSASQLRDTLSHWQRLNGELAALNLDARQTQTINSLREEIIRRAASPANLDPLTRSDREGELQTWLEDRNVDNAWEIAPALVAFGWNVQMLEETGGTLGEAHLALVAQWLGVGCSVYALLDEVGKSAERISEIVKSVKSYSYLDQAPVQQVNIHDGLENTLVILRHKLKQGVQVTREYASDLPTIEAYASELNQVWTNILDNAIDAMKGAGELKIRTYREDNRVGVEISDNGPGIPPEIQPRIFDPFFTTKPPGIGTGLGLHISYNIIQKHGGKIQVASKPGATVFRVSLPIRLK